MINEKIRVQIVQQSLNAIKETIVFGRQKYFSDLFNNINNSNRKVLSKYFTFLELPKPIIELIGFSCLIVFIIVLISLNYEGKDIIPPIATFCLASYKILPSANKILISIQRIRFAKLLPGAFLEPHTDAIDQSFGLQDSEIARIAVPLQTNEKATFSIYPKGKDGPEMKKHLQLGHYYYTDVKGWHSIANKGDTDRIHLLIDCISNKEFRRLLVQ